MDTPQDFVNLFVDATGELLYFISIFVIYQAALLMALDQRRRSNREQAAGRYVVALVVAELAWLMLMGGALYEVVVEDATSIMPPLEYAVNALVLVCLSWGLLTAEHPSRPIAFSVFSVILLILLVGAFAYTLQQWNPDQDFNEQNFSTSWTFITAFLAAISALLLLTWFNRVADIPLKLLFFGLIVAGNLYTLVRLSQDKLSGDASGGVRWAIMTSSALVVVLVYRMVIDRMTTVVDEVASYAETISRPQRAVNSEVAGMAGDAHATNLMPTSAPEIAQIGEKMTSVTAGTGALGGRNEAMELIKALGIMLDREEADVLPKQTVMAVAEVLKADIVAVVSYDDANWADVVAAYDYANKQPITGMSINLAEQPTLLNAIQTKRPHKLDVEQNAEELQDLYTRLDITGNGPTYLQPLNRHGKVVGALIVGLPYTRRDLRTDEIRLLESIGPIAARLLIISRTALINRVQAEERAVLQIVEAGQLGTGIVDDEAVAAIRQELQQQLELAQREINELSQYIQELQAELDQERSRVGALLGDEQEALSITQRIDAISKEREILEHERQQLARALKEAQATLAGATADDGAEFYNALIENMKAEIKDLRDQKAWLEQQLAELRTKAPEAVTSEQVRELLKTLTEEKTQLASERDNIMLQLQETQRQLEALSVEGGVQGLAKQLARLNEERLYFKTQAERAILDRDVLLKERQALETAIVQESAREAKIIALEDEIARLISDREVLAKSRDSLKSEREGLLAEREHWYADRARMLAHNDSLKMELDETLAMLNQANRERQESGAERNQLAAERDMLRAEVARIQNERDSLLARIDGDRERLQVLGTEGVGTITGMIEDLTRERAALEERLLVAEQKAEALQRKLMRQTAEYQAAAEQSKPPIEMDVIISLAQELRTPLSVIIGYTDTVLNESVGILGALQRKLLTRVKANVDRLTYLVEELVQVVSLDRGDMKLEAQKVNLIDVIDDAITASRYKFSEKGIVLDMDVEGDVLEVQADVEALRQIINHLIQNAYLVSPTDGTVLVTARFEPEFALPAEQGGPKALEDVVYVAIKDQGGGINPEDQKRVFSRLYRADNPLIAGLGDTGVGMSITKALIEAHGGLIWLETLPGVGNTFKFVLPVRQPIPEAAPTAVEE